MTNKAKAYGDAKEREAAKAISDLFGFEVRRLLGAGRTNSAGGDVGDIHVYDWAVQVGARPSRALAYFREKPAEAEQQRINAGKSFATSWVRMSNSNGGAACWRPTQTPEQWAAVVREIEALKDSLRDVTAQRDELLLHVGRLTRTIPA